MATAFIICATLGIGAIWSFSLWDILKPHVTSKELSHTASKALAEPEPSLFAYSILQKYRAPMIGLANRTSKYRKSNVVCLLDNQEVLYEDFDKTLFRLMKAFKEDKNDDLYNHVAQKHRHFFSIFVDSITKVPTDDDFFTIGSSQQEHEQILAMAHDYHQTILSSIALYQQNRRQAVLTTIKEAYTYENEEANLTEVDQSALIAIEMKEKETYGKEDELALAVHFPELTSNERVSFTASYNGTIMYIPPGHTVEEARMALSDIYPELKDSTFTYDEKHNRYDFQPISSSHADKSKNSIYAHFNHTTIQFPANTPSDVIRTKVSRIYPEILNMSIYRDGNDFYFVKI